MKSANDIRQQFIDFFVKKHGHTFVPSSSVVPHDDPTLLFTNAGMNQFKDVFLGIGTRPYKRAVNSQKCIRAGGKHNDLEDVGKDTYHHTFFEMLGNWSFGDYFKKEAIAWAWELLTKVWKLDKARLHATVFEGDAQQGLARDDEAFEFWQTQTDIDPAHIHFGSKKDNFWEMGDTGPCGPCSEIHYDRTKDTSGGKLVNAGRPEVIEIWNLVFIQFNRTEPGQAGGVSPLIPLRAKHVDTGMGFERITAVLQGKDSNYDTDVFTPIFQAIQKVTQATKYTGKPEDLKDTAYRVIADHIRTLTFALTDGAKIGTNEREYVLRRILRRAERYGRQYLGTTQPFLCEIVPSVVDVMGGAFPELKVTAQRVAEVIREEEASFARTLDRGIALFNQAVQDARKQYEMAKVVPYGSPAVTVEPWTEAEREYAEKYPHDKFPRPVISDVVAFKLHETYGFPIDLTQQMAQERGLGVDQEGYLRLMKEHEEKSRAGVPPMKRRFRRPPDSPPQILRGGSSRRTRPPVSTGDEKGMLEPKPATDDNPLPKTDDSPKYHGLKAVGRVVGWVKDNVVLDSGVLAEDEPAALLLDQTNFYAEQGGQVGDVGVIVTPSGRFQVEDTQKQGDTVLHIGRAIQGQVECDQQAMLELAGVRADTMRNHTSTHLLNWALRKVLGGDIDQKGSLVDPEKTRFDFSHDKPLSPEQIGEVERLVNEKIYADLPVTPVIMLLAEAKKIPGVRAVFGEKYPDPVRVLLIGVDKPEQATLEHSVEFCGGTHLTRTGQAGFFKIISQEAVGKGVRRVTAVTGRGAVAAVQRLASVVDELTGRFRCQPEDLPARVDSLQEEIKKLQQQVKKGAATDLQASADKLLASATEVRGVKIIVGEMPAGPEEQMRQQVDRLRQKAASSVVVIGWSEDSKVGLIAAVTEDLVKKGLHAGKLVGELAKVVSGKGGGRPTMAQAGGKDPAKLAEALELAKQLASQKLASS